MAATRRWTCPGWATSASSTRHPTGRTESSEAASGRPGLHGAGVLIGSRLERKPFAASPACDREEQGNKGDLGHRQLDRLVQQLRPLGAVERLAGLGY